MGKQCLTTHQALLIFLLLNNLQNIFCDVRSVGFISRFFQVFIFTSEKINDGGELLFSLLALKRASIHAVTSTSRQRTGAFRAVPSFKKGGTALGLTETFFRKVDTGIANISATSLAIRRGALLSVLMTAPPVDWRGPVELSLSLQMPLRYGLIDNAHIAVIYGCYCA